MIVCYAVFRQKAQFILTGLLNTSDNSSQIVKSCGLAEMGGEIRYKTSEFETVIYSSLRNTPTKKGGATQRKCRNLELCNMILTYIHAI